MRDEAEVRAMVDELRALEVTQLRAGGGQAPGSSIPAVIAALRNVLDGPIDPGPCGCMGPAGCCVCRAMMLGNRGVATKAGIPPRSCRWIEGPPTEPGRYWIAFRNQRYPGECLVDMEDEPGATPEITIIGDLRLNALPVTHHMEILVPEPPKE